MPLPGDAPAASPAHRIAANQFACRTAQPPDRRSRRAADLFILRQINRPQAATGPAAETTDLPERGSLWPARQRRTTRRMPGQGRRDYRSALTLLASLFFMWGFITVINNTLLPHLRSVFELDYTADHPDRIGLVHRLFRRLDPVGQADRAHRLSAVARGRAGGDGGGVVGHDAGGQSAVVRRDAGDAVRRSPAASRCCRSRPTPTWRWSAGPRPRRRDSTWCRR